MANKQKCMIIGAVPIKTDKLFKEFIPEEHFVVCADAGYETALRFGIRPDLIVGDFDSASKKPPEELNCLTLPVAKDVTDTRYAVMRALRLGLRDFVLLGCLGGKRFDHSVANLEVLQFIVTQGGIGILADEHTQVILLNGRRMKITGSKGSTLSVFPYNGPACNVTYQGLKYPLERRTLTCGGSLMGVSNEVVDDVAAITVHSGTALIILYNE